MSSGKYLSLHWLWIYSFAGGALHGSRCAEPNLCRNQEGPKCRHAMERGQRLLAPLRSCCLHFCWMQTFQILGVFDHSWKKSGWRITDQKRVKSCPVLPKSSCTLTSHVLVAQHVNNCSITRVLKTAFPAALLDSPVLTMCLLLSKGKGPASHWRNGCWAACAQHLGSNCVLPTEEDKLFLLPFWEKLMAD